MTFICLFEYKHQISFDSTVWVNQLIKSEAIYSIYVKETKKVNRYMNETGSMKSAKNNSSIILLLQNKKIYIFVVVPHTPQYSILYFTFTFTIYQWYIFDFIYFLFFSFHTDSFWIHCNIRIPKNQNNQYLVNIHTKISPMSYSWLKTTK